jgi:Alpha/beta hydrolase domain
VDAPGARYVARMSAQDPLRAGMKRFDEGKLTELYDGRQHYLERVIARVYEMIRGYWILPQDAEVMKLKT